MRNIFKFSGLSTAPVYDPGNRLQYVVEITKVLYIEPKTDIFQFVAFPAARQCVCDHLIIYSTSWFTQQNIISVLYS